MRIVSIKENKEIEKRISITPEIAKKYLSNGFSVTIQEGYGEHLSFSDNEFKELGVDIKSEKEIIDSGDIIVQMGLLPDDKLDHLKKDQILIGVLNPYLNKEKIDKLINKKINNFSLELLPRITRAQSMDILSSQANLQDIKL